METILRVWNDRYIRQNIIFFSGSMLAAFFNYLFHPLLGRILSVEAFGELQFILSLFAQLSVLTLVFSVVSTNVFANSKNAQDSASLDVLKNIFMALAMGLFILLLAASSLLVNRFRLEHPLLVSFPALILTTSIVLNYRHSLLQGRQDFTRLSLLGIINAFNRLILALGFAYLGFGVAGALGGFVLAQLIGITLAYFLTRKLLSRRPLFLFRADASLRRELAYGFTVLLASGAIAFFGSFDVVIIKYLFPAYESGLYSGIATIGRIIYFAAGPVAGVLLASVRLDATQEDNRKLLRKALAFMAALCLPLLLVFCVWPETVIHLMIGERYLSLAYLLPYLSLLMLLLSLLNVFVMYALALRRKWLRLLSVSAVALTVVLLFVLPVSFISVLVSLGGGTILMLLGIIFYER